MLKKEENILVDSLVSKKENEKVEAMPDVNENQPDQLPPNEPSPAEEPKNIVNHITEMTEINFEHLDVTFCNYEPDGNHNEMTQ